MDYDYLLRIKVKYHLVFIIVILILIGATIYILNMQVYENFNFLGVYNNSNIFINVPIDYSDTLTEGNYIKIKNKKYEYEVLEISEINIDSNMINYQTFTLKLDEEFKKNEALNITVYFRKEKLWKKIKEML